MSNKSKPPSTTEFQLLALVVTERPGREVAKLFKDRTGKALSYGTLYTTLSRMTDEGWVKARDADGEDRRVRFFKITGSGTRALNERVAEYSRLATFVDVQP